MAGYNVDMNEEAPTKLVRWWRLAGTVLFLGSLVALFIPTVRLFGIAFLLFTWALVSREMSMPLRRAAADSLRPIVGERIFSALQLGEWAFLLIWATAFVTIAVEFWRG